MPNWCQNVLVIEKPSEELIQFLQENKFSFQAINPPKEKTVDAHNDAWSTKWDLDEHEQEQCANNLIESGACSFSTAWSPPEEAIRVLSERFPNDLFALHYEECGMCFAGSIYFSQGNFSTDEVDWDDKEELVSFLVEKMFYDEEDAREYVCGYEED